MAIPLVNKQKFKESFRLVENPKIIVLAMFHEPPKDIRYSNASSIRMIEIAGTAVEVQGKQIQSVGRSRAIYLMGSFMRYRDDKTYRGYEATHIDQPWYRQVREVHPVSGLETGKSVYDDLGKINICVIWDSKAPYDDMNPNQFSTIFSTDKLLAADVVGPFLIREVKEDYGLYMARAEYKSVTVN